MSLCRPFSSTWNVTSKLYFWSRNSTHVAKSTLKFTPSGTASSFPKSEIPHWPWGCSSPKKKHVLQCINYWHDLISPISVWALRVENSYSVLLPLPLGPHNSYDSIKQSTFRVVGRLINSSTADRVQLEGFKNRARDVPPNRAETVLYSKS